MSGCEVIRYMARNHLVSGVPALVEDGPGARVNVVAALLAGESLALPHQVKFGLCNAAGRAGDFGPAVTGPP